MCHFYCHSPKAQIHWMDHWTTIVTPDIREENPTRNPSPRGGSHVTDGLTQLQFLMQHVYAIIVKWFRSQRVATQIKGALAVHETLKLLLLCWSDRPHKYISNHLRGRFRDMGGVSVQQMFSLSVDYHSRIDLNIQHVAFYAILPRRYVLI